MNKTRFLLASCLAVLMPACGAEADDNAAINADGAAEFSNDAVANMVSDDMENVPSSVDNAFDSSRELGYSPPDTDNTVRNKVK